MAGFADYLENKTLDHIFGGADYTRPGTLYFGLSTTTPTDAGTNITEPSTGAYARVAVTNNATNFPAASGGAKSNGTAITFPTATDSWGTITHVVIYDASTSGNVLAWAALNTSKAIYNGDTLVFPIGDVDITLD